MHKLYVYSKKIGYIFFVITVISLLDCGRGSSTDGSKDNAGNDIVIMDIQTTGDSFAEDIQRDIEAEAGIEVGSDTKDIYGEEYDDIYEDTTISDVQSDDIEFDDAYIEDVDGGYIDNVIVNFEEDSESLYANPGMGWQTFYRSANDDKNLAGLPSTCIYYRFSWIQLEPEEGKFNFELIDNWLKKAKENGQRLAFRLMVSASGTTSNEPLLGYAPLWLRDAGASGWVYYRDNNENKMQDANEPDVWSPDLADPVTEYYHTRLVKKLAERYNGNPFIDLIDIGSVGLWGEWHFYAAVIKEIVGNPPTGGTIGGWIPMYSEDLRKKIIDLFVNEFPSHPKTMLIGDLYGLQYATSTYQTGWRADCWGDMNWHMPKFYDQQLQRANAMDIWQSGLVALEPCWTMQYWYDKGWDIKYIINWALEHHATYIQNKSGAIPPEWQADVREGLKKIGYRLTINRIIHPEEAFAGRAFNMAIEWENKGVAPPYFDYYLRLKLIRNEGGVKVEWISDNILSVKGFLPGTKSDIVHLDLPEQLPGGVYDVYIGIMSPYSEHTHPNLKCIKLALKNVDFEDCWYRVSRVAIK